MVRIEPTADDSLAEMRARSRFGIAMAAMIRMIATTISNSISEKPFCFRISFILPTNFDLDILRMTRVTITMQVRLQTGRCALSAGTCLFSTVELLWNTVAVAWKLKLLQNVIPTDNFCQPGRVVLRS